MRHLRPCPPDRIPCCVPFCGRTFKRQDDDGSETMCGRHFRMADAGLRRRQKAAGRKARREWERANSLYTAGKPQAECEKVWSRGDRWAAIANKLWDRIKAQASTRQLP